MAATPGLSARAADLRSAFDRGFAAPARGDTAAKADLIAIRVGDEPCAIRLSAVSGLFADRKVTRVPGRNAALLGIAGFRGTLVPVYSLRAVLGQSGTSVPRWLVVAASSPIAVAFDAFEGHLRAPADSILPRQSSAGVQSFAPEFVRAGDVIRPIIHLPSVIAALGAAQPERPTFVQE